MIMCIVFVPFFQSLPRHFGRCTCRGRLGWLVMGFLVLGVWVTHCGHPAMEGQMAEEMVMEAEEQVELEMKPAEEGESGKGCNQNELHTACHHCGCCGMEPEQFWHRVPGHRSPSDSVSSCDPADKHEQVSGNACCAKHNGASSFPCRRHKCA